jgi:hypothetical protein
MTTLAKRHRRGRLPPHTTTGSGGSSRQTPAVSVRHTRLWRIVVLYRLAVEIIRPQAAPDTLFYCGPPFDPPADYPPRLPPRQRRRKWRRGRPTPAALFAGTVVARRHHDRHGLPDFSTMAKALSNRKNELDC